jgi:hypothetical protein
MHKFHCGKSSRIVGATPAIFSKNYPKVNSHPTYKNSPNLVTLDATSAIPTGLPEGIFSNQKY